MSERMDWTYDKANFSDLPNIVKDLHESGMHYVNIIDPAIKNSPGYFPFDSGVQSQVFIKDSKTNDWLVGVVWPGTTVFPDFTHPNASQWWALCAKSFHDIIPFDGIWIDMNEPSNFVEGSITGCNKSDRFNYPPYTPRNIFFIPLLVFAENLVKRIQKNFDI